MEPVDLGTGNREPGTPGSLSPAFASVTAAVALSAMLTGTAAGVTLPRSMSLLLAGALSLRAAALTRTAEPAALRTALTLALPLRVPHRAMTTTLTLSRPIAIEAAT